MTSSSISGTSQPKAPSRPAPDAGLVAAVAEKSALVMARLNTIIDRHPNGVLANSLGAEDMVITDLIHRQGLAVPIATLQTGALHAQTLALIERLERHYGLTVARFEPQAQAVLHFLRDHGERAPLPGVKTLRSPGCRFTWST